MNKPTAYLAITDDTLPGHTIAKVITEDTQIRDTIFAYDKEDAIHEAAGIVGEYRLKVIDEPTKKFSDLWRKQ